jgi:hypothetical protein
MADLTIRDVEPVIVAKLQERAEQHGRSVEEEHRSILRNTLLADEGQCPSVTFEGYLRTMPDVGTDDDFARVEGAIRDLELAP